MREFVTERNSTNKENIENALSDIRKWIEPHIYNIGRFGEKIIVDSINCPPFSESLYIEDKNDNKFFFPMNTLFRKTKMKTDFNSNAYNRVVAKQLGDNHYGLYKVLNDSIDSFGEIYVKSNSILCVFEDIRKTEIIYKSRENSSLEYRITVEKEECIDANELEKLATLNDSKKPMSLHEYLNNYRLFRDIDRHSCIYISSINEAGVVGEIGIKHGCLEKYSICESEGNFRLDMTMEQLDIIANSTDEESSKAAIEGLPNSLQRVYQEGVQLIRKCGRKSRKSVSE